MYVYVNVCAYDGCSFVCSKKRAHLCPLRPEEEVRCLISLKLGVLLNLEGGQRLASPSLWLVPTALGLQEPGHSWPFTCVLEV